MQIRLHSASVSAQKNMREFVVKRQGKSLQLRAESDEDCQSWIEQIQQCISEINEQDCQFSDDDDEDTAALSPPADAISDKACKHITLEYLLILTCPLQITM